jgi:hypothetical protein
MTVLPKAQANTTPMTAATNPHKTLVVIAVSPRWGCILEP